MKRKISLIIILMIAMNVTGTFAQSLRNQPELFKKKVEELKKPVHKKITERKSPEEKNPERKTHKEVVSRSGALPLAILNFEYDENGKGDTVSIDIFSYKTGSTLIDTVLNKIYIEGAFINNYKEVTSYTSGGMVSSAVYYYWDEDLETWIPGDNDEYTYDQYGNMVLYLYQYWDQFSKAWVLDYGFKTEYTYTSAGKISSMVYSIYTGSWEYIYKEEQYYNSNDDHESSIYYFYDGQSWVPDTFEEYTLNTAGEWTEIMVKTWNSWSLTWEEEVKIIDLSWHNFQDFLITGYIAQVFDGMSWENNFKYASSYNSGDQVLFELYQEWDGSGWMNTERDSYTYDAKNNLVEYLWEEYFNGWEIAWGMRWAHTYNSDGDIDYIINSFHIEGSWNTYLKQKYLYTLPADITKPKDLTSSGKIIMHPEFSFYPNPAKERIALSLGTGKNTLISIYNMTGSRVMSHLVSEKTSQAIIDISGLENGVYILQVKNGESTATKKLVKN